MTPHEKRVSIFETKEQYQKMLQEWKKRKAHTGTEHIIYNLLRGYDRDRGFSPITKQSKIANGGYYNSAMYRYFDAYAIFRLNQRMEHGEILQCFGDAVNPLIAKKANELYTENQRMELVSGSADDG